MNPRVEAGVRQLFLDDEMIERMSGLARTAHVARAHPASPVFRGEMPWEQRVSPATILRDPASGKFRMWYCTVLSGGRELWEVGGIRVPAYPGVQSVILTCYAESENGLHWIRPTLRQLTFEGSLENNIIDKHDRQQQYIGQGMCIYHDEREPDASRRYKFFHWARRDPDEAHLLTSADGISFQDYPGNPIISGDVYDSSIEPVWSPEVGKYLSFGRYGFGRTIALRTSDDLIHWSAPQQVLKPERDEWPEGTDWPHKQFYHMSVHRYEGQFVGLLNDFYMLEPPSSGELEISLASSRDGIVWQRVANREPIIRRSEQERHIRTPGAVIVQGDEIWIYYSSSPYWHGPVQGLDPTDAGRSWRIRLATLRRDGFVSLFGDDGWLQTRVFAAPPGLLHVNADVASGQLVAEVLDRSGRGLGASDPLRGNWLEGRLRWRGAPPWRAGDSIALRFHLKRGRLFSYWFRTEA